jgi:hypothetical protein
LNLKTWKHFQMWIEINCFLPINSSTRAATYYSHFEMK